MEKLISILMYGAPASYVRSKFHTDWNKTDVSFIVSFHSLIYIKTICAQFLRQLC